MTELRWVVAREQVGSAFSTPLDWVDGSTVYIRLQYREQGMGGDAAWQEIPVVNQVTEAPRIALVPGAGRGH